MREVLMELSIVGRRNANDCLERECRISLMEL
jgi:hypothetical protein